MKYLTLVSSLVSVMIIGSSITPAIAQTHYVEEHPTSGRVESTINGDIACYLTIVDDSDNRHENIRATFDLCANQNRFLNQRVNLEYGQVRVNNCQGAEPCTVTRLETVATEITVPPQPGIYTSHSNTVRIATRDRRICYQGFSSGGSLTASVTPNANQGDRYSVNGTDLIVQQSEPNTLSVGQEDNMISYTRAEAPNAAISPSLERCLAADTPFFALSNRNPYSPSSRSLKK
jgi:hypothetical protein